MSKYRLSHLGIAASCVALVLVITSLFGCGNNQTTGEDANEIVVLSYGGAFADAQRAAYFAPFAEETGIEVQEATYGGEYGKIQAAVQSGQVWDVADIESSALIRGVGDSLFLPIDYTVVDTTNLIPSAIHPYGVGTDIYSVSLGFNTDAFPEDGTQPDNWEDFWNVDQFPGPRCLKKDPRFTLEIALMADGVPPAEVYANGNLNVDRAFRSLEKIKSDVTTWWTTGQQPIQLLADGECVMTAAFGARLWNAQHKDDRPVKVTWNQSIADTEYWVVPRGASHPEAAMRFIAFASRADRQAVFPEHIPLGPTNKNAFGMIESTLAEDLNTYPDNFAKHLILNAEWWAEHEAEVLERWNTWLLEPELEPAM